MLWVNGARQETVSAFDRGLAYGDGLFATMRCTKEGVLFIDTHMARLTQSAKRLGIQWQPSIELKQLIASLVQQEHKSFNGDFCLKLLLSRGVGGRGYQPPEKAATTEVISFHPIPSHYRQWQSTGIALQTSNMRLALQTRLAGMKHLNRLEQVLIKAQILGEGFDDWLVLDTQNTIIESSMANLFLIKNSQVVTPSLHLSGVAGVMREQLIYWFIESGFDIDIRPVTYSELGEFEHVLLSNSLFGVVGINRIDQWFFSPSELIQKIIRTLSLSL
ncbi:aminodeoxychorismate lyase [Shewanella psychrotolerans]|uniref:aminodeoxychorismate lyase n=1 Tax=Shewanella psychrotolerans TaxID=2864206 RepID=UPI001C6551C9|nr:aminodeoxychorismate lyase [Shewanella psychrotolerans]